jgi:hypothetical protein
MTKTQEELVAWLREHGGRLVRLDGGRWATPDASQNRWGEPVPSWTSGTVRALERRGLLVRAGRFREEWKDDRILRDDAGRDTFIAAMTCRCQGTAHEGTCPDWKRAYRYNVLYAKAHRRFIRREVAWKRMRPDLDDAAAKRIIDLVDQAWVLRDHLRALWRIAASPQLLRRLLSDRAAGRWKETRR